MQFSLTANGADNSREYGNYLYVYSANGPVKVTLKLRSGGSEPHLLESKSFLPGREFDGFRIEDVSGGSNDVEVWVGKGDYQPSFGSIEARITDPIVVSNDEGNPIGTTVKVPTASPAVNDVALTAGAAAVEVLPANTSREEAVITVPLDMPDAIRFGDAATPPNATRGAKVYAGGAYIHRSTGPLYAFSMAANIDPQTVSATETNR